MMDIDFDTLFTDLFDKMSERVDDIGLIVSGIVGLGTLFYFAAKIWGKLASGEPLDILPLLRPAVIVFLCLEFQSIVITPTHYILSPLRTYTNKLVKDMQADSKNRIKELSDRAEHERDQAIAEDPDRAWYEKIGDSISSIWANIKEWLLNIILNIFSFFKEAVYLIMNCLRIFFLIFLGMVGPIAFALSLFPGFEGSLTNWYAKYVSIWLWAPICNIISVILSLVELRVVEVMYSATGTGGSGSLAMFIMLIVFYILGAYAYLSLPTLATWVVQGGASALELAPMLKGAHKAALVAGGTSAAAGGNVAGRAGNIADRLSGGKLSGAANSVKSGLNRINRALGGSDRKKR
jgi:conjugative transposon TraJ protein